MNQEISGLNLPAWLKIKNCRRGTMAFFGHDIYVGRSLDVYGEFSESEVSLFNECVQEGSVVVEVGANIGAHTVFLAQKVGPTGQVFAFEPQRQVFQVLCSNIILNGFNNVHAFQMGLAEQAGMSQVLSLDATVEANIGGRSLGTIEGMSNYEPVIINTLDSFNLNRLDFLKIDVEDLEKNVLDGSQQTIARCRPILYVENDREDKSETLIQTIFDLGYNAWWHIAKMFNPNNHNKIPEDIFVPQNLASFNLFCVPKEIQAVVENMDPVLSPQDTSKNKRSMSAY